MNELKINDSIILVRSKNGRIYNSFYHYIVSLLKLVITKNNLAINIILNLQDYKFHNENLQDYNFHNEHKTIKIGINYEHTLLTTETGGKRWSNIKPDTEVVKIMYDQTEYFVCIQKFDQLTSCDVVIDYSMPNVFHVKEGGKNDDFSKKHIYIAPSFMKTKIENRERTIQSLTTFSNVKQPRRKELLETIRKSNLDHTNITNCFGTHVLQELLQNTKVLINIHQFPSRNTFEELRCLPALQNGVIVISEKSPLNHLIPYNDLIIWCDYDNIVEKTKEVLENYKEYFEKIFTTQNIELLYKLDDQNEKRLEDKIMTFI